MRSVLRSRSIWTSTLAAAAGLLLVTTVASAESAEVEEKLRRMSERLTALEDRLESTHSELESARETVSEQRQRLEQAGLEDADGDRSALSSFLEETDFSGWVATSYNYNFNGSGNDFLVGQSNGLPFHADSNAFEVNQLWFEIDNDVSEEGRGGFHADILFGADAEVLGGSGAGGGGGILGNDGVEVFSAYASYLVPVAEVRVDAGELPTLLGAEVVQSPYNFNITRGRLWGIQPVTHTGVIVSKRLPGGVGIAAGVVNDALTDANFDTDDDKAYTGQLSFSDGTWSAAVSAIYGSPLDAPGTRGFDGNDEGLVDLLMTADPSDNLSFWFNFKWGFNRDIPGSDQDAELYGAAAAVRWAILQSTGMALRYEILNEDDGYLMLGTGDGDSILQSFTTTLDHAFTDGLVGRLEYRVDWSRISDGDDDFFRKANTPSVPGSQDNQHVLLAELIYNF